MTVPESRAKRGGTKTAAGANIGVRGETITGVGVQGHSFGSGIGVFGQGKDGHAIKGLQGATGTGSGITPDFNFGAGVHGESDFG